MIIYTVGKVLFWIYFKVINRITIHGKEHIPKDKGILLCSNHINNLDPPFLGTAFPRPVRFMAKNELFNIPVLNWIIKQLGAFPVRRGESDRQALRQGMAILKNHEVLGIFPEGTRSKTGELGKGFAGVGFFALRSDAAVVPAAIVGSYKPFRKVIIYFGKPIEFEMARENKITPEKATELIMQAIQDLINHHKSKEKGNNV